MQYLVGHTLLSIATLVHRVIIKFNEIYNFALYYFVNNFTKFHNLFCRLNHSQEKNLLATYNFTISKWSHIKKFLQKLFAELRGHFEWTLIICKQLHEVFTISANADHIFTNSSSLHFCRKNFYFFCRNHLNSDAFSVETDTGNVTSLVQQFNIAAPFAHYIYVQTLHKYTCLCSVSVWPHQNLVRFPNPNQLYPTHAKLQKNHEKIIIYSYFVSIEVIFIHFVSSWKQLSHFKFSDEEFLSFPPFCFFNRFSRLWFVNLSIFP